MKARDLFDAIGVVAAAAVVTEQAIELLAPYFKGVKVKAPAFLPAIVTDIPARTANAFAAFTTSPGEYASTQRRAAPSGGGIRSGANGDRRHAGPRVPANDRLTHQPAKAARA